MNPASKAIYAPLSACASVAGGLLAGAIFNKIWYRINDDGKAPPDPKDLSRPARAALTAAALQGLVFGLVRAVVDRAAARSYRLVAHESPSLN